MLTPQQLRLLTFIDGYIREHSVAPTYGEMRAAMGCVSKSNIHRLMDEIEYRGFVRRLRHKARAIEVIRMPNADITAAYGPILLVLMGRLIAAYDEEAEAILIDADAGCTECTAGTTPRDLDTGLCTFHRAKQLVATLAPKGATP